MKNPVKVKSNSFFGTKALHLDINNLSGMPLVPRRCCTSASTICPECVRDGIVGDRLERVHKDKRWRCGLSNGMEMVTQQSQAKKASVP
ncbi:hypothetical protein NC651_032996 [Populus alba x Populus x berolinensis]|nr:hypothetical protein NC651_032996 [Populus alba x Populus x berolinensis]